MLALSTKLSPFRGFDLVPYVTSPDRRPSRGSSRCVSNMVSKCRCLSIRSLTGDRYRSFVSFLA